MDPKHYKYCKYIYIYIYKYKYIYIYICRKKYLLTPKNKILRFPKSVFKVLKAF